MPNNSEESAPVDRAGQPKRCWTEEDFANFFLPHYRYLFASARRLAQNTELADDLVHETIVAFFDYVRRNPKTEISLPWRGLDLLTSILHRKAIDHHRRLRRAPKQVEESVLLDVPDRHDPTGEAQIASEDQVAAVWQAIGQLPEDERRLVIGRYFERQPIATLAEPPQSTAYLYKKLKLAITNLRGLLPNPDVKPQPAVGLLQRVDRVPQPPPADGLPVPPEIAKSLAAYTAELPELLKSHPHKWIAYIDGRRSRIADTQTELYQYCLNDLGLAHDKFIVECIVPESGSLVEYTLR